jgi:hypothetical protein
MSVEVGSLYRSTLTVTDSTGALVAPTTKVLTVTLPDQTLATPTVVTDSTGHYHVDYAVTQEGLHKFVWVTTGPQTSRTDFLNANAWRSVVGIDEVREYINYVDTDKDAILRHIMLSATELVESICGVCVQRTFTDERIPGTEKQVIRLPHGPLPNANAVTSITSVWPGGPTWAGDALIVYPDSATVEPSSWMSPFWYGPWKATYVAGRTIISANIQLAVKEIIYDLWAIQRPFGLDSLELGPEETAAYETALSSYEMPPHAKSLLEKEAMPGFA